MALDANLNMNQHWCNQNEVAEDGYDELLQNTRLLLNQTINNASTTYPAIGHFYTPLNGHLTVRMTALKFDAPDGLYTYFIGTGQNEQLRAALQSRFKNLMSKDLRLLYLVTTFVYIATYTGSLLIIETTVFKRIVLPILDITIRIRDPIKMSLESQTRTSRSSSG